MHYNFTCLHGGQDCNIIVASIPQMQSAHNFFVNIILIRYYHIQIFSIALTGG
jgi:hypothetical protein